MCAAAAAKPWYRFGRSALDHWHLLVGVVVGQVVAIVVVILAAMSRGQPRAIGDGLYAGFLCLLGLVPGLFFDWHVRAPGVAWLDRLASTVVYRTEQSFHPSNMPTRDLERAFAALARTDRAW